MYVAMNFIQARLNPMSSSERANLSPEQFDAMKEADLSVLISPYLAIGLVIVAMFIVIMLVKMPKNGDQNRDIHFMPTLKRIFALRYYREGVIAQFFYVGAQIMCWTFIIQYGTRVFMAEGMGEQAAEVLSQRFNIAAMLLFICSRFVATYLMKYVNPARLLAAFAIGGMLCTLGVILFQNRLGMYCLVAVSGCMSLMFPTIYGIALKALATMPSSEQPVSSWPSLAEAYCLRSRPPSSTRARFWAPSPLPMPRSSCPSSASSWFAPMACGCRRENEKMRK